MKTEIGAKSYDHFSETYQNRPCPIALIEGGNDFSYSRGCFHITYWNEVALMGRECPHIRSQNKPCMSTNGAPERRGKKYEKMRKREKSWFYKLRKLPNGRELQRRGRLRLKGRERHGRS